MQSNPSIDELLAQTELFRALSPAQRATIQQAMVPIAFTKGASIFSRGDAGGHLYLVTEGRVRLSVLTEDGRELAFAHATSGDVFGEIAAIDGGPRTADASAIVATKAMSLSKANVERFLGEMPTLAKAVAAFLCLRLRNTDVKLETIVMHPIEVRLARLILAFARSQGHGDDKMSAVIKLDISQSELGLLIGASRPKVNAALVGFADTGVIEQRPKEVVCQLNELRAIAGES
jgi:CRP/FNR family transcriptional regulator, cyclic AMP receptor protein